MQPRFVSRAGRVLLAALLLAGVLPASAAELTGVVFEDSDGDGQRGADERGLAGIAVSNGRDVVRSDETGSYALPRRGRFVFLTRPAGFDATPWYRDAGDGGGDFALRPRAQAGDGFFFVQISDVHAYATPEEFFTWSSPGWLAWLPDSTRGWLTLQLLERLYPDRSEDEILAELRAALEASAGPGAAAGFEGGSLVAAYFDEFARPGSSLGAVEAELRAALAEVASLRPAFVVSTGDQLLEGNAATPAVAAGWLRLYRDASASGAHRRYDTIGNNELVGFENDGVSTEDPLYGTGLWERELGPTAYSFDRGPFHFVALDTHRPTPGFWDRRAWSFAEMREEVREWLDRDLALHGSRTLVVLNHEPFVHDPSWPFEDSGHADDQGLFEKHGVDYVLTGHVHHNGRGRTGSTEHVTTGALSGLRWVIPPGLHPRGYRLWYAKAGRLFGVWKPTGEVVLDWAEPEPWAAGAGDELEVVWAAADRRGPFASLELRQDGETLHVERWGDYFARTRVDRASSGSTVVLVGVRADGTRETAELPLPPTAREP